MLHNSSLDIVMCLIDTRLAIPNGHWDLPHPRLLLQYAPSVNGFPQHIQFHSKLRRGCLQNICISQISCFSNGLCGPATFPPCLCCCSSPSCLLGCSTGLWTLGRKRSVLIWGLHLPAVAYLQIFLCTRYSRTFPRAKNFRGFLFFILFIYFCFISLTMLKM